MKIFNVQNPQFFFIGFVFSEKIIFRKIFTFIFFLSGITPPPPSCHFILDTYLTSWQIYFPVILFDY